MDRWEVFFKDGTEMFFSQYYFVRHSLVTCRVWRTFLINHGLDFHVFFEKNYYELK